MTNVVLPAKGENSSFSAELPGLQIALDSTSLGEFKQCPRKYYYSIIRGLQRGENPHLTFGLAMHGGVEAYHRAKAAGGDHRIALHAAMKHVLATTWSKVLNRPIVIDHPQKNRTSLIRTLVWYLDQYGRNDGLKTWILSNGKPAVELSFSFPIGMENSYGEPYSLCGHLDRIAEMGESFYIPDVKTTGNQLGEKFLNNFSPDNQFTIYTIAGKVAFGVEAEGMILDGVQVGSTFARFQRYLVPRKDEQLTEWLYELQNYWIPSIEESAQKRYWPMNDKACGMYGGCPFQPICSKPSSQREQWLRGMFHYRKWDPMQARGDV